MLLYPESKVFNRFFLSRVGDEVTLDWLFGDCDIQRQTWHLDDRDLLECLLSLDDLIGDRDILCGDGDSRRLDDLDLLEYPLLLDDLIGDRDIWRGDRDIWCGDRGFRCGDRGIRCGDADADMRRYPWRLDELDQLEWQLLLDDAIGDRDILCGDGDIRRKLRLSWLLFRLLRVFGELSRLRCLLLPVLDLDRS